MVTDNEISALFDNDFLERLESLNLLARQLVRGSQRADRRSSFKGSSPEFAEYRAYIPGDDTRYIDWNAYARWRHLVIKLFVEEHDLPIYLLLDCSPSMNWGDPLKFTYARQVVAGLAYIGLGNHDRIGIIPLGAGPNRTYPANRGKDRFWHILHLLASYQTLGSPFKMSLDEGIRLWLTTKPQRGLVLWISDLWGEQREDAFHALDRLRYSRHEIGVLQVFDARETTAGDLGEFQLESVESGNHMPVIIDQKMRQRYRNAFENYQESLQKYCRRYQIPLLQSDTTLSVYDLLIKVLQTKGFVT